MGNLPITFKIPREQSQLFGEWLESNNMFDRVSYDWITGVISFGDEDDANAFYLKFGIHRYETQVERMLRNEESNN